MVVGSITGRIKKRYKAAIGGAAATAGLYARNFRSKMLIVAFHRVNDQLAEDDLTCGSEKFAEFCKFFRRHFTVVPLSVQAAACRVGKEMGGTLSITFDDGYRDNFEIAAPILRRLELPATFFVTTGFVSSRTVPYWDKQLAVHPGWMDWNQVRALATQGFEIGCHTDTHIDLGTADAETVRAELELSRRRLRTELGSSADLFAYPFGGRQNICERSLELVRAAGFTCCVSCYGGVNTPSADPFGLKRVPIAKWFATPNQFGFELLMGRV
jgi:peptidoglycan/xylan/chitin deacetylase (PgdA/CDA1 family)